MWLVIFLIAVIVYLLINVVIVLTYTQAILSGPPPDEAKFVRRDIKKMLCFGLPWILWLAAKGAAPSFLKRLLRLQAKTALDSQPHLRR